MCEDVHTDYVACVISFFTSLKQSITMAVIICHLLLQLKEKLIAVSIKVVHQTASLKHLLECSPIDFLYLFEFTC